MNSHAENAQLRHTQWRLRDCTNIYAGQHFPLLGEKAIVVLSWDDSDKVTSADNKWCIVCFGAKQQVLAQVNKPANGRRMEKRSLAAAVLALNFASTQSILCKIHCFFKPRLTRIFCTKQRHRKELKTDCIVIHRFMTEVFTASGKVFFLLNVSC